MYAKNVTEQKSDQYDGEIESRKIEEVGEDSEKGKLLVEAKNSLNIYYSDCRDIFIANYTNEEFTMN